MSNELSVMPSPALVTGMASGALSLATWPAATDNAVYVTSIDESRPGGSERVFMLLNGRGAKHEDYLNTQIEIQDFLLSPAEWLEEDTGEMISSIVVRLCLVNGDWIEIHSKGVLKSLGLILWKLKPLPWTSPLVAKLVKRPLTPPKSWVVLEPVFGQQTAQKSTKK